ncbi:MAG TPA: TraR/DksA C4-type zinc finger protein [Candidatus Sulfotelmatobacter sp.]|nr:TraR/DksA C4-type zinc finger protein [Candidatus Sulfotelmatobacter sp.]
MRTTTLGLAEHLAREEREVRQRVQDLRRKRQRQDTAVLMDGEELRKLDMYDAASLASLEQHNEAVFRRLSDKSQALAEAQERLREGTYGLCRACGTRIPRSRLEAVPTATLCVPCQERREAFQSSRASLLRS